MVFNALLAINDTEKPVPEIPGYTPNVSTVTPENPGKNTPVVYTPNEKPVGPTTPSENGTPSGNTGNPTPQQYPRNLK